MRRIYSARTELEAHDLRLYLESHGVRASVIGESVAFTNFPLTTTSGPGIAIDDTELERAAELVERYLAVKRNFGPRTKWKCGNCGEVCEKQFEICWKCESPRPDMADDSDSEVPTEMAADSPAESENYGAAPILAPAEISTQARRRIWFEVVVLLAIAQPWWGSRILFSPLAPLWDRGTFAGEAIYIVTVELFIAACALSFVATSNQPWSKFGLYRVQPLMDLFGAGILCIVAMCAVSMSNGLFYDFAHERLPADDFQRLFHQSSTWVPPQNGIDLLFVLVASLSIGFAEELVYRGILIPRFEQLFRSTGVSVLLSSVLFATMHWTQGPLSTWNAMGMGLIFGIAFAHFRHLWPLVFAHALWDFQVLVRSGGSLP